MLSKQTLPACPPAPHKLSVSTCSQNKLSLPVPQLHINSLLPRALKTNSPCLSPSSTWTLCYPVLSKQTLPACPPAPHKLSVTPCSQNKLSLPVAPYLHITLCYPVLSKQTLPACRPLSPHNSLLPRALKTNSPCLSPPISTWTLCYPVLSKQTLPACRPLAPHKLSVTPCSQNKLSLPVAPYLHINSLFLCVLKTNSPCLSPPSSTQTLCYPVLSKQTLPACPPALPKLSVSTCSQNKLSLPVAPYLHINSLLPRALKTNSPCLSASST